MPLSGRIFSTKKQKNLRGAPINQYSNILGYILQIFPNSEFCRAVEETRSERGAMKLHILLDNGDYLPSLPISPRGCP
jgi:hypothetical protein